MERKANPPANVSAQGEIAISATLFASEEESSFHEFWVCI